MISKEERVFRSNLVALGIDNVGSGLFLPTGLIYLTRSMGLPLGLAAAVLAAGTGVGLVMPALAARRIDAWGPGRVVAISQLVQAAGMGAYLLGVGGGLPFAVFGAVLTAGGAQLFYSALGKMTKDMAAGGSKDEAFASVEMVRSAAFGVGGLAAGALLTLPSEWLSLGVAVNAVSFVAASAILARAASRGPAASPGSASARQEFPERTAPLAVLRDVRFLVLAGTTFSVFLSVDLFLVLMPVFAESAAAVPGWTVGACVALSTVLGSTAGRWVVRVTSGLTRTGCFVLGAAAMLVWAALMAATLVLPVVGRPAVMLMATVFLSAGSRIAGPRLFAVLGEIAPSEAQGAYFAYMQYAFTAAQLCAPLLAALLALGPGVPWLIDALILATVFFTSRWLARSLPEAALRH